MLCPCASKAAECGTSSETSSRIHQLYQEKHWEDVVREAAAMPARSADIDFDYGMALAHLQRWREADDVLREGHRLCPEDKRFPVELAGIAFQQKLYPKASDWLRAGLKLDRNDEYALNFAGTTYYLMGNIDLALKYWNRVHKPYVAALEIDPNLRLQRRVLDRAFAFGPAAVLGRDQYMATESRLHALGIFPVYSIGLNARADGSFNAEFHALERDGFGNRWQALIATLGGLPYETVYPAWYNAEHGGLNLESLLRWDPEKERVWFNAAAPLHGLPQWRWRLTTDNRWENWVIRRSFTGAAPALGSLHLVRHVGSATLTSLESGRTRWMLGAELSHRSFDHVTYGSALNSSLVGDGFEVKQIASVHNRTIDVPEHRFTVETGASSEAARLWSTPARLFTKLQGEAQLRWLPQPMGDTYEFQQRVRAGTTFGDPPFDELWMLGVERDNDLWLRGIVGTRDGRKGSAPLANRYLLSNTDFDRRVYSNGLVTIKAGPLFDAGRAAAPVAALARHEWQFSAGAQVKLTVFGVGAVFTYGRDLRTGTNAFFATMAQ